MAAYNKLNDEYATEHRWLLTGLLRAEWGWDGVVVSDWYATQSTAKALTAGLDVEMPGPSQLRGDKLLKALEAGELSSEDIDRSARRVLRLVHRTQQPGKRPPPASSCSRTTASSRYWSHPARPSLSSAPAPMPASLRGADPATSTRRRCPTRSAPSVPASRRTPP
jgi:beta-glucosidase